MKLNEEQLRRYSRQLDPSCIRETGQEKLLSSTVLIVGCGALGSMVSVQLAGAGVGHLILADFDTIDISNLQRQFFFKTEDAGKKKSKILSLHIKSLNPDIDVEIIDGVINQKVLEGLDNEIDFIVDATDNPSSKLIIEKYCKKKGIAYCIAGVSDFHGQVLTVVPGGAGFYDLFNDAEQDILPCSLGGVMGPTAALCASLQASEVIKYLSGNGCDSSQLLIFNLLDNKFDKFKV